MVRSLTFLILIFISIESISQIFETDFQYINYDSIPYNVDFTSVLVQKRGIPTINNYNLHKENIKNQINSSLFSWLMRNELINKWNVYGDDAYLAYSSDYEEFVQIRTTELSIYTVGRIKVSADFDSYALYIEEDLGHDELTEGEFEKYRVVILNFYNGNITSIFEAYSYSILSGHISARSIIKHKGENYHFFYFYQPKRKKELIKLLKSDSIEYCRFSFDSYGRILRVY